MKKILILCVLICGVSILSASVADIEKNMSSRQTSPYSESTSGYKENRGGYETSTEVIGSKQVITRRFASPDLLGDWLNIFRAAKVLDLFEKMQQDGWINRQGLVLTDHIPDVPNAQKGRFITLDDLKGLAKKSYSVLELQKALVGAEILTPEYFLQEFDESVNNANEKEEILAILRKNLLIKVESVNFPVHNSQLQSQLKSDIIAYLLNLGALIETEIQETTTFESKYDLFSNPFGHIFESIFGEILRPVLHPDRVRTNSNYRPFRTSVHPYSFFDVKLAFSRFPYDRGLNGPVMIAGQKSVNRLDTEFLSKDGVDVLTVRALRKMITSAGPAKIGNMQMGVLVNQFKDATGIARSGTLFVGGGSSSDTFEMNMKVGLTYLKGMSLDGLGYNIGFSGALYPMDPLSITAGFDFHQQPDLFKGKINWDYVNYNIGLNLHLDRYTFQAGYKWINSGSVSMVEGAYGGLSIHL